MSNLIHPISRFFTIDVYWGDTDSIFLENKHWENLDKARLVSKALLQCKNAYKEGGIFNGLFLAPKKKCCLTINNYGVFDEHKTFKGFINVSDNLEKKRIF